MAALILKRISKKYGKDIVAVKELSLEIAEGELVVLVGPSGCGKSTTLRMIAGLEEAYSGEIYMDGRVIDHVPVQKRDMAMIFQNYALYPTMTVFENIAFPLQMRKIGKKEIKRRIMDAARLLEIEELLDRRPGQLSGGEKQRVAMGRAIVREPKVFLMDEPLSNLDAKLRISLRGKIAELHKKLGATIIYVTHDQAEAMTLADKIVVMKDGCIEQVGVPQEIYEHPANPFVASFFGDPPMNFFEKNEILYGLRPENVKLASTKHEPDGNEHFRWYRADIVRAERIGAERIYYLNVDGHSVTATTYTDFIVCGQDVWMGIEDKDIHCFGQAAELR